MHIFNKFKNLAAFCVVMALTACASAPKTDIDPTVDFSQFKTFQWQYSEGAIDDEIQDPVYDSPLFEKKLEAAVSNILLDKGLTGAENPDIYFTYHIADVKHRNFPVNFSIGYGSYGGFGRYSRYGGYGSRYSRYGRRGYGSRYSRYSRYGSRYGRSGRSSIYWGGFYAPNFSDLHRDEVLVIVDAIDTKTNELVWRGWTKSLRRSYPHEQHEMINIAQRVLAGFPIG